MSGRAASCNWVCCLENDSKGTWWSLLERLRCDVDSSERFCHSGSRVGHIIGVQMSEVTAPQMGQIYSLIFGLEMAHNFSEDSALEQ